MNPRTLLWPALLLAGLFAHRALPHDFEDLDPQAGQQRMQRAMTLGKQHEMLGRFLGEWDIEMRVYGMGDEPVVSKGKAVFRWQIPGRWLAEEYETTMMGMPYRAFVLLGYDTFKRKWVHCSVDSMFTQMLTGTGNANRDDTAIVTYGTMDEPTTGEIGKTVKYARRLLGEDEMVLEVWDLVMGEDERAKVVEIHYRRAG